MCQAHRRSSEKTGNPSLLELSLAGVVFSCETTNKYRKPRNHKEMVRGLHLLRSRGYLEVKKRFWEG